MSRALRLVILGDSLSKNATVMAHQLWPEVLCRLYRAAGYRVRAINLASNGQSSEDMLDDQLPVAVGHEPDIAIVGTAGNDYGDGLTQAETAANMRAIIQGLYGAGCARVFCWSPWFVDIVNGDTLDATGGHAGQITRYRRAHDAVSDACAREAATYLDAFVHFQRRFLDGIDTYGTSPNQLGRNDVHPNVGGFSLLADFFFARIPHTSLPAFCHRT